MLTSAIKNNDLDDWRNFRNFKNGLDKEIKSAKQSYLKNKFDNSKDKWKTLKSTNNIQKQKPPSNITY